MRTVFLFGDTDDLRELMAEALEHAGYQVLQARHGREALDLLEPMDDEPSLLLVDLMMPVMGGRELVSALQADGRLAPLPVVVTTALDQADLTGVRQVLRKPIELGLLLKVVEHYCCPAPA